MGDMYKAAAFSLTVPSLALTHLIPALWSTGA